MKPATIINELATFMRRGLRADPGARICVGLMRESADGSRAVSFALANNIDRGDIIDFADSLLRHASESIINGLHPDCEICRGHLKRIEAARGALGLDSPERLQA